MHLGCVKLGNKQAAQPDILEVAVTVLSLREGEGVSGSVSDTLGSRKVAAYIYSSFLFARERGEGEGCRGRRGWVLKQGRSIECVNVVLPSSVGGVVVPRDTPVCGTQRYDEVASTLS